MIGLFSVIVVVGAMLFGLWLAKSSVDSAFQDYEVVFNEAVSGLSQGSSVQYSGIKVGDVTSLRLDPKDPRRVLARIRLSGQTPIKEDTQAKLALTGITGTSIIQLSGGTPQSPELKGKDGNLPEIIASPSPIARLLNNSNDLMTSINLLLHNANRMFSHENVDRLSNTLDNLQQTTGAIAEQRGDIKVVMQQLMQVSKQASAALEQTTVLMRNANGLLNDQGKQAFGSAEQAMKSLEQSTATINTLLTNNKDSVNSGMQGLNELAPAVRELRETLGVHAMKRAYQMIAPVALVLISACSILPKPDPSDVYRLASAQTTGQGTPVAWSLRVNKPQSSEFLDSPRIAVVPNGDLISSYANSRWSDPSPVLLRNRFMDGFQRDGRVTLLSTDESNLQADYELGGQLQAFQSEYHGAAVEVVIRLDARLVRGSDQRIIASRRFEVRQPVSDTKVPAVVAGFGAAGDQLNKQVVDWVVQQGNGAVKR
ncbi:hypothetical protein BHE74_00000986 [Ensete ventricosum]|nr:hypothetical protein BHE74_00000986 [Ensete ventricosum]